ncbi:metalloregulator ArsR/SmtB family transcription factor [Vibrio sp. SS-MA-C1-2]|uniref:ArsR/SmtB family transcription factor n=1 Tax=Vibrio sp. SS-MA-C1-2 TaxID=2908646 RepID=UPI001F226739|nr:metalloregulator ArsR/SmtB family transcription factor [Vibrio sp. SS-MA-C1-2]UJF17467.1 metalloregulator ArsR/SmtB family transcription factor [Vibrio sp. SS-MA-C1-2]
MDLNKMRQDSAVVAELLKTIAHSERLMVLCQLIGSEVPVSQLQANSVLSQSALSQHLTVLKKKQLVTARKEAQQVFYSLADQKLVILIQQLQDLYCPHNES